MDSKNIQLESHSSSFSWSSSKIRFSSRTKDECKDEDDSRITKTMARQAYEGSRLNLSSVDKWHYRLVGAASSRDKRNWINIDTNNQ